MDHTATRLAFECQVSFFLFESRQSSSLISMFLPGLQRRDRKAPKILRRTKSRSEEKDGSPHRQEQVDELAGRPGTGYRTLQGKEG